MKKIRCLAVLLTMSMLSSMLPIPTAFAAASFANATIAFDAKNITAGDTNFANTINASPGDTVRFFMRFKNEGADAAVNTLAVSTIDSYTYTPHSTFWAWSGATNTANNNKGVVLFSPHYIDSNANSSIDAGDIRVNYYGVNDSSSGPKYASGSTVAGGDYDDGKSLTSAVNYIYITGGNATWSSGKIAYVKGSGNVNTSNVEVGDIRMNANGSYIAGTIVVGGDSDICSGCLTQANNIYRYDNGSGLWPFGGSGFPVGDVGVNRQILIKETEVSIHSNVGNQLTPGISVSANNAGAATKNATINVDTTPSVVSVSFSPTSITNDGVSSTTITAEVSDKNGVDDITGVTIDLSSIGGSSAAALSDSGGGTWTLAGIMTTASAATYNALTVTATDSTAQTAMKNGSLIVQAGGTPTVTINSTTPTTIGSAGDVTANWQADEGIYKYELRLGSCSGSLLTGTNVTLGDGSAEILATDTPVNSILDNSNFSEGSNAIYVCATDADANVGQNFTSVTKDLTAPSVTVLQVSPSLITTGGTSNVTWKANESGTYSVGVGSCGGTVISGANASGTYSTPDSNVVSGVNASDLTEGANTIYVCVTDTAGNAGQASSSTLTKDTTPPSAVTGVTLVDNDNTYDGVDGRDITISWTPASTDSSFSFYRLYILPEGTALDTGTHNPINSSITTQSTNTWTGTSALTTDSANATLAAGSYVAYVIAVDTVSLTSSPASSPAADLVLDDTSAPTFSSARTIDVNTVRLTFSEPISFVDTSKITATGLTIDTSYNANNYTSGYRIGPSDTKQVFLRVSELATSYTASDLALGACAVRDVTGNLNLNESGNCADTAPVTNANAAVSGLAIADGVGPTITLTSPASAGTDNATVAVAYTLSEAAAASTVRLKFTATGGAADSRSPHTIILTDAIVCASSPAGCATSAGSKSFTFNGGNFTSIERGAADYLQNGTIYTVELAATDTQSNIGTPASNTSWAYDTTPPTAPVTTQAFSSPTANTTPVFTWGSVADAASYTLQLSLSATNYSPAFTSQTFSKKTVTNAVWGAGTATVTAASHGLSVGETVSIASVSPSGYNGSYSVASVPTADTFTVAIVDNPGAYTSGGTALATSWTLSPAFASDGSDDDTYIWRVYATDAAGNQSSASNQQTFVLNTTTNTPTLTLADSTNSSQTHTNSQTVAATIDGYTGSVTHYLLSETQSTQPATDHPDWIAIPGSAPQTVSFSFANATEETKTVYVWVKDNLGNVSDDVSSDSIALDTTPPATPTLATADANAGANTGKTNAAAISVTIGNDSGVAAWCVASGASGFTPTNPTESSCTNLQIGSSAVSGWLGSRPTTHTLNTTGVRDVYVWTRDSAGNVSNPSLVSSIDYQTSIPPDPTLTLTNQANGGSQFTASTTVNVSVTNDATAWRWIVSTTQSSKPSETSGSWGAEPATINLAAGDGLKTVYVWVKNEYGNISANQVSASITLDTAAPTFSTRKTQDLDGNGQIDAIQITMNENILDSTLTRTNFTLGGGYTTRDFTGTLGAITFTNGISTGSSSNDSIFYLAVTESGSIDTGATPTLTYTAGTLTDRAGNLAASTGAVATTDGARPVLAAANPIRVLDTNASGRADQIRVIFSEALASTTATAPWTLSNVPSGGTLSSVALGTTSVANDTIVMTLTEGSAAPDTSAGSLTVALDNSGGQIADGGSNTAASFGATAAADFMGPVLVSANYIATGDVADDSIILTFSESVSDASVAVPADFSVASGGSIANAIFSTGDTANDNSIIIELNAGDSALTVGTSTIALSGSGVIADTSAQANTSSDTAAVTVGGGLVINEISWAGSDGKPNDQWIELRNLGGSVVNFDTQYHCLYVGGTKLADLTGSIAGSGYYLVSRYNAASASSALAIAPDLSHEDSAGQFPNGWVSIPSNDMQLILYASADASCDTSDSAIDTAGSGSGAPFAGSDSPRATMERNNSVGLGTSASSWHTAVASVNFDDENQKGTPKSANIADATAPSFDTGTRFPGHQSLMPTSPGIIRIDYADNLGGVGVDIASVTMEIDRNGDGDYADAGEGVDGICSGAALTVTTTRVSCDLAANPLTHGKKSVRVTVADLAGNSAQTSWDFWVDHFTVTIENQDQANLGALLPGTGGVFTSDNSRHTKITITTYGAGVAISGTANDLMSSGAATIAWHTNNTGSAGIGAAYRVKEGIAGLFGNYFNWQDQSQIASKAKMSGATLSSTNELQTYTFFVQYYADAAAMQNAGVYQHVVSYDVAVTY